MRGEKHLSDSDPVSSPLPRWWDAYPQAKYIAPRMSPSEVAELIHNPNLIAGDDYAIIDVRRDDYEVRIFVPINSCGKPS